MTPTLHILCKKLLNLQAKRLLNIFFSNFAIVYSRLKTITSYSAAYCFSSNVEIPSRVSSPHAIKWNIYDLSFENIGFLWSEKKILFLKVQKTEDMKCPPHDFNPCSAQVGVVPPTGHWRQVQCSKYTK